MNENKVHEIFAYPQYRNSTGENFLEGYLAYFSKVIPFLRLINFFSSPFRFVRARGATYAFHSTRLADLIGGLGRHEALIFGKPQEFMFSVRRGMPFYPVYEFIPELFRLFSTDPLLESRDAARLISRAVRLFTHLDIKNLIIWNDSLFLERFLVYCARQAGVRSVCVQHGIFQSITDMRVLDGHYADYMLVFGESQRQLYQYADFPVEKVRVLGYPFHLPKMKPVNSLPISVCILGQHWESISTYLGNKKMRLFCHMIGKFQAAGIAVYYKPHPYEDKRFFPTNAKIARTKLADALANYDVFISLTSTALIEASLCGKIAIQLFDEEFEADDFSVRQYCYSHRDIETIVDFVRMIREPYRIPAEVIYLPQDLDSQFRSVIKSLDEPLNKVG